jgi:hypothetical protein
MALIDTPCRLSRGCRVWLTALALLAGLPVAVWAGGPFLVTTSGQPFRWDSSQAIRYRVDKGALGTRNHDAAVRMVQQGFQTWLDVPTARIQVQPAGELTQDITGRNVMAFLNGVRLTDPSFVLFDTDGSIIETLAGRGASQAILGFTRPAGDLRAGRLALCYTILNGPLHDLFRDVYLQQTITHELGHFLGLEHSEINGEAQFDGNANNDVLSPIMSYFRGPNGTDTLHYDDQAWLSWLYPTPEFTAGTGMIQGRVLLPDGKTGLAGIDVIARRVDDPEATAVSCISGYLFANGQDGSPDLAHLGEFLLPGLPPGTYTLEVSSLSGQTAHRMPDAYLIGGKKFWQQGSTAQDPPDAVTQIVVNAGQTVTGVDVILNGDDLGEPRAVAEKEPNELPNGQLVTLPAVITGEIEDAAGDTAGPAIGDDSDLTSQLQDVYRFIVRDPTTITATLSTPGRGVDLDLYLVAVDSQGPFTVARSNMTGTPPETIQIRLPAGRFYLGVHRAADRGSAYTLRVLATPSPEPDPLPEPAFITYLTVGDVTTTGATARWQTLLPSPSDVWFNLPVQEVGSTKREIDHAVPLPGLLASDITDLQVYSVSAPGLEDVSMGQARAAVPPAADGAPRIVVGQTPVSLFAGIVEMRVRLTNAGDGDATRVRIEQIGLPSGWLPVGQAIGNVPLPSTIDLGDIGAGGIGAFVVRLFHVSGNTTPKLTLHGTYTDRTGAAFKF